MGTWRKFWGTYHKKPIPLPLSLKNPKEKN
jgi:hypothetical protein